jgi:outer membrane protein
MGNYIKIGFAFMTFSISVIASEQLDLSLKKAVKMAIERNERSQIARHELRQAQLNYKQVRSNIFPTITAELTTQKSSQKPSLFSVITGEDPATNKLFDNYTQGGTINIVQPVYTFGRFTGALEAAKFQREIAKTNQKVTISNIKAIVSQQYFNALFYKQLYDISKNSYQNTLDNRKALQKRISFGRISQDQNLKMKADIFSRKPALIESQRQYEYALSQLKNFLKLDENIKINLEESLKNLVEVEKVEEPYNLSNLAFSSLLKNQFALYKSLETITSSDYYPTLSLFGSYGKTFYAEEFMGDSFLNQDTTAVGLKLSWSFSTGGEEIYAHSKAKIQTTIKQLEYEKGTRELDRNLKDLFYQMDKLIEKKQSLSEAVNVASQSYNASLRSFSNGSITQTQLNDRELLFTNNKIAYAKNLLEILLIKNQIKTYSTIK